MTPNSRIKDFFLILTGAVVSLVILVVLWHFGTGQSPAEQIALKAKRVELVDLVRLDLASAAETEKSSVLAVTDKDSQAFADQSRAASARAERESTRLGELLAKNGTQQEKNLFVQFSKAFADLRRVDNELLALAVKNTNLKAYSLAFGPAADALKDMNTALSRLVAKSAGSPDAAKVATLAFGAQTAALRVQTLLAPHIAEESDKKMDELEARMAQDDQEVGANLHGLAALPKLSAGPDLAAATADYARFNGLKAQIIVLSRENTNVRSLAMSLGQKRKVMLLCEDALNALQQAIQEEPIPGATYGAEPNPRLMESPKPATGE